ncbi:MAG TPA: MOSC domain-containing protein, partial [Syntrophales bacterium]|nr:MOSC domain-containing protein [Syntrophales bacterium]
MIAMSETARKEAEMTEGCEGVVVGVCMSERRGDPKKNVGSGLLQPGVGLVGDSHAGTAKEITILARESVDRLWREKGISAEPGFFAENIATQGLDTASLVRGSVLEIGRAKLEVMQIGKDPSEAHTYQYKGYSLLPSEGVFCRVIEGGEIRVGDKVVKMGS